MEDINAGAGFLTMRYAGQIKYSWGYNWGIFREIWDMFTLHNYRWLIVGLLVVLCILPGIVAPLNPTPLCYLNNSLPPLAPAPLQDIIPAYYWEAHGSPPFLQMFVYFITRGSLITPFTNVLCIISGVLLLGAYLREGSPGKG